MSWKPKDIITETWSIYRSSGKDPSRSNFYDFTLSIIAWQILEQDNTIAGKDASYSLHIVIQRIIQTKDTGLLEKALLYWDGVMQQQERITATPGLLSLDLHAILNIPHPLLSDLLSMWADYFGYTSKQAADSFIVLLEVIEEHESIARGMISTPRELVEMMAASVSRGGKNPVSVYDPFARNGDLLAGALQKWYNLKQVQGSYTSGLELKLATLRLLCNAGADTEIVLSGDLDIPDQAPRQFDLILSNPPFGAKASDDALHKMHAESLDTLAQRTRRLDVLFLGHILDSLSAQGQAAVLLPAIFISGNSLGKAVIAELLAQNVLDMVVELPHGLFTHTGIAPVLLCLSKTRNADQPVWLVDATAQAQKQGRQSRLNLETLLQWFGQIKAGNSEEIKEITAAKPADIESHEYNLYRMLHSGDSHWDISRELSSVLYKQCLKLEQELALVQEKMKTLLANPIQ